MYSIYIATVIITTVLGIVLMCVRVKSKIGQIFLCISVDLLILCIGYWGILYIVVNTLDLVFYNPICDLAAAAVFVLLVIAAVDTMIFGVFMKKYIAVPILLLMAVCALLSGGYHVYYRHSQAAVYVPYAVTRTDADAETLRLLD